MLNYILDTLEDRKYLLIIGTSSCYHIDRDDRMFLCKLFREIERRTRASDDFEAGFEFGDIGSENDNNYSRAVCHERSITRRQLTLKNRLESRTIRFPKDHPSPFPLLSFSSLNPPRDIRFPRTENDQRATCLRCCALPVKNGRIIDLYSISRIYTFTLICE